MSGADGKPRGSGGTPQAPPANCHPLRVLAFYFLLSGSAFLWGCCCLLLGPLLPYRLRYRMVAVAWSRFAVDFACRLVGIRYRLRGVENIPQKPCVVISKHQSTWETFFLSALFQPLSQVLKKELLNVPFFGWGLRLLKPIALDRHNPKQALKRLAEEGQKRLEEGSWVLIFPEGTRVPVGEIGKFSRGAAALAVNNGLPLLPIAHNAGRYWPKTGWGKRSGTIDLVIGPPLYAQGDGPGAVAELNERAFQWIKNTQREIDNLAELAQGPTEGANT